MTRTLNELIAELVLAYPKALNDLGPRGRDYVRLLASKLSDIPMDVLGPTVDELISTEKWFPSIAEIRERCAERMLALPNEMQAINQIFVRMGDRNASPLHPLVNEVLNSIGGYSAFRFTEASVIRGQFGRLYREERARRIRELQVGSMALDAGGQPPGLPGARDAVS